MPLAELHLHYRVHIRLANSKWLVNPIKMEVFSKKNWKLILKTMYLYQRNQLQLHLSSHQQLQRLNNQPKFHRAMNAEHRLCKLLIINVQSSMNCICIFGFCCFSSFSLMSNVEQITNFTITRVFHSIIDFLIISKWNVV